MFQKGMILLASAPQGEITKGRGVHSASDRQGVILSFYAKDNEVMIQWSRKGDQWRGGSPLQIASLRNLHGVTLDAGKPQEPIE